MIRGLSDRPVPVVRMGREKTILLGFLGLLAGVFVGVLSLKLLVPRPPTGAGPDIRPEVAVTTAQERVEPPAPSPAGWDFAAAPPLVPEAAASAPPAAAAVPEPARFSRFAPQTTDDPTTAAPVQADGNVAPASWHRDDPQPDAPPVAAIDDSPPRFATPTAAVTAAAPAANAAPHPGPPTRDPFVTPTSAVRAAPVAGEYLVQAGDSWWGVAERAYGDGRLYRALFAWNRARAPRVTLAPGTRLDVPPLDRLQAAWPRLTSPAAPH